MQYSFAGKQLQTERQISSQERMPLLEAMKWHVSRNIVPFDVPGHKRAPRVEGLAEFFGESLLQYDVNSMPGLDNLGSPTSVIADSQALMASAFDADHAFFIVGGTTQSVHAMVLSVCGPGDQIICPRNIHKSVVNALILADAMPVYIQAEVNERLQFATGVSFFAAKETIDEHPDAKAILLINPTYYGACSPLAEITAYAHEKGMIVIVDEAHGAHFHFHEALPPSAMSCRADLSAVSIHKTGGSLTQSSALLLQGDRVSKERVQKVLSLLQTTSASYLLMTSLDIARRNLAVNGTSQLAHALDLVRSARKQINEIPGLYAYGQELADGVGVAYVDETKLGIHVAGLGLTGFEVYDLLYREYHVQMELADTHNVLAIVSLGDCAENLQQLVFALRQIALKADGRAKRGSLKVPTVNPCMRITPRQAFYADKESIPLAEANGRISAESIMVYPPGIPVVTPGEEVTAAMIDYLLFLQEQGSQLTDMKDAALATLEVVVSI